MSVDDREPILVAHLADRTFEDDPSAAHEHLQPAIIKHPSGFAVPQLKKIAWLLTKRTKGRDGVVGLTFSAAGGALRMGESLATW